MPWLDWLLWRPPAKNDGHRDPRVASLIPPPVSTHQEPAVSRDDSRNKTDRSQSASSQAIAVGAVATIGLGLAYHRYFRRYPTIDSLDVPRFRGRSIYGYVAHVGDGDNFRLYHMPGGRLLGWGWFPGRRLSDLDTGRWWWSKTTIHVRIAGIDAPELSHFGNDAQPYGQEAQDWLKEQLLHTHVRAYPYSRDRYHRVVGTVYQRRFLFFKSDVGYNMIRSGLATVFEANTGSEFGGKEDEYRAAEAYAKQRRVGMWQKPGLVGRLLGKKQTLETPREYKTRTAKEEQVKKGSTGGLAK